MANFYLIMKVGEDEVSERQLKNVYRNFCAINQTGSNAGFHNSLDD